MQEDKAEQTSGQMPSRVRYWTAIGVAFVVLALSYSTRAALGLSMPVWEAEFGWSRSFVSGVGATALLVMAVVAPVAGYATDRLGARAVLIGGLIALGVGSGVTATTDSREVFFVAFGIINGIGFGIVAWNVVSVMVARIVTSNLGTATGIANTGSSAGQFMIVPILGFVLVAASWRWSFAGLAICALALIPVVWLLLAGRDEDKKNDVVKGAVTSLLGDLGQLVHTPVFHLLFWSFFLCGYTTTGVIETHFLPYAAFCGFGPVPSSAAYGILSVINTIGMIGVGWLADRVNRPLLLASIYLLRGGTFVILMQVGASYETLLVFAAFYGVVDYSTVPVTVSIAASHLGLRTLGLAMGLIAAGHNLGGALGAFAGGYLYDLTLGYEWVWISSVIMAALAGVMAVCISDDEKRATLFKSRTSV